MKLAEKITEAKFLKRINRFTCLVEISGKEETVYLPNSGRLNTVLIPGQRVFLVNRASPLRVTKYDLVISSIEDNFVSVDSRIPGNLIYEVLCLNSLPQFSDYPSFQREVTLGKSRLDFRLNRGTTWCYLEVKSVTLVGKGTALFPDAPTSRGRRHLESLIQAKDEGHEAALLFVVQRNDADSFSSNDRIDPDFGIALRKAQLRGVGIYAYRCKVTLEYITLSDRIPVYL